MYTDSSFGYLQGNSNKMAISHKHIFKINHMVYVYEMYFMQIVDAALNLTLEKWAWIKEYEDNIHNVLRLALFIWWCSAGFVESMLCIYIMHEACSLVRSKRNSRLIRAAGKRFQWLLACFLQPKVTWRVYFIPGRDKHIHCDALQGTSILATQMQWQSSPEIQCQGTRKGWA